MNPQTLAFGLCVIGILFVIGSFLRRRSKKRQQELLDEEMESREELTKLITYLNMALNDTHVDRADRRYGMAALDVSALSHKERLYYIEKINKELQTNFGELLKKLRGPVAGNLGHVNVLKAKANSVRAKAYKHKSGGTIPPVGGFSA